MSKLILAGVIFLIAFVVSRFFKNSAARVLANPRTTQDAPFYLLVSKACFFGGFLIAAGIVLFSTFRVVPAGSVGVVTIMGKVQETPLYPGFSMVNPIAEVYQMSTQIQRHSAKYDSSSKDLQKVHVDMTLNFALIATKAPEMFQKVGADYSNVIIDPAAQEVLKAETARHVAADILQQRPTVKDRTQDALKAWLSKYGIDLTEISLADVNFDPDYTRAIEQKQVQEQKAEQKRYEILQAQRDAEIRAASAKGEADAAREAARGRADALQIEAAAQADYNKKIAESLTPVLISNEYLKRWDGKLPVYMFGDSKVAPMFQLPAQSK